MPGGSTVAVPARIAPPVCPSCADPEPAWEIASPVRATDLVRFDAAGLTEVGLFPPEDGLEPLGRPAVSCAACGTVAAAGTSEAVLKALIAAGKPFRTPGDA
jgi:hypothetical protein